MTRRNFTMKNLYTSFAILFILAAFFGSAHAVTVTGTNTGAIADGTGTNTCGAPRNVAFAVTGARIPTVATSVSFTGTHTYIGDLQVQLIGPGGSPTFPIFAFVGRQTATDFGDDSDVTGTYVFQDGATLNLWTAAAGVNAGIVPPGTYRTQAAGPFANDSPGPAFTSIMSAFTGVANPNGTWTLRFLDCAAADTGTISAASLTLQSTTAAETSISGRVVSSTGRGIRNARITVGGPTLPDPKIVMTNPFGYFTVTDLSAGQTYIVTTTSKQYTFSGPPRTMTVNEDLTGLEFVADPIE